MFLRIAVASRGSKDGCLQLGYYLESGRMRGVQEENETASISRVANESVMPQ